MNNESGSGVIVGVVIVIVIAIVGWLAYSQGFFNGQETENAGQVLEVNLGETNN